MVVGPSGNTKTWHLPKNLLVNASPFFAAALNGSFAEATSKVITLPEDNTDAFTLFIRWLFVGNISGELFNHKDKLTGDEILGTCDAGINSPLFSTTIISVYLQACILGDKLGCPEFQDLAMLEVIDNHEHTCLPPETIRVIYEQSGPDSKLRRFAIDMFRYELQGHVLPERTATFVSTSKIAKEFGLDFLNACLDEDDGEAIKPQDYKGLYLEGLTNVD